MRWELSVLILLIVFGVSAGLFFVWKPESPQAQHFLNPIEPLLNSAHAYVFPLSEPSYLPIFNPAVADPQIDARAALVYDTRSSRYLFAKNSSLRLPIASLTKILSAVVVVERLNSKDTVTISKASVRVDGERQDLYENEQITVGNLLTLMLVESSNDAAYAISSYATLQGIDFIAEMNRKAQDIGMLNSRFFDPAGLNDNGYSTVQDLAKLASYAQRYAEIWDVLLKKEITVSSVDGKITHRAENTNQLLGVVPNVVGGKTGYTEKALGCLILLVDIPGQSDTIVSIILGSPNRFNDTERLVSWVTQAYRWK